MKKLITFLFMATVAMTFASCGNGEGKASVSEADSLSTVVDSVVVAADSLNAEVVETEAVIETVDSVVSE